MKLIVGLGNPDRKYQSTLHNIGFKALDYLADSLSVLNWNKKFKSLHLNGCCQQHSYILLKPQTYMNLSGEAVLACMQFYKLELSQVLVISDDIDRDAGLLRYRMSGGHGGHNGLRNIINICGNSFHRLRIGVGRPGFKSKISDYVLSRPSSEVNTAVENAVERSLKYQLDFIQNIPIQITD